MEVVCFEMSGHEFGVDMTKTKTIENRKDLIARQGLPDFVTGIIDVHGEMIPLIDLSQMLSIPKSDYTSKDAKTLVFLLKTGSYAIPCDKISEIIHVEGNQIQHMPNYFVKRETDYTDCVIQKGNSLVLVLDPNKLLSDEQKEKLLGLLEDIERERIEEEKRKAEELRRKKEEEKRKREEEMKAMAEKTSAEGGTDE